MKAPNRESALTSSGVNRWSARAGVQHQPAGHATSSRRSRLTGVRCRWASHLRREASRCPLGACPSNGAQLAVVDRGACRRFRGVCRRASNGGGALLHWEHPADPGTIARQRGRQRHPGSALTGLPFASEFRLTARTGAWPVIAFRHSTWSACCLARPRTRAPGQRARSGRPCVQCSDLRTHYRFRLMLAWKGPRYGVRLVVAHMTGITQSFRTAGQFRSSPSSRLRSGRSTARLPPGPFSQTAC